MSISASQFLRIMLVGIVIDLTLSSPIASSASNPEVSFNKPLDAKHDLPLNFGSPVQWDMAIHLPQRQARSAGPIGNGRLSAQQRQYFNRLAYPAFGGVNGNGGNYYLADESFVSPQRMEKKWSRLEPSIRFY